MSVPAQHSPRGVQCENQVWKAPLGHCVCTMASPQRSHGCWEIEKLNKSEQHLFVQPWSELV